MLTRFYGARWDARRTIPELVKLASNTKLLQGDVEGHKTLVIRGDHPDNQVGGPLKGSTFELHFDPEFNFMVRRVVSHVADVTQGKGGPKDPTVYIRTVKSFKSFENGVFVPAEVELGFTIPGGEAAPLPVAERFVAKTLIVNQPLPEGALDFKFPEHAQVRELPMPKGSLGWYLWGPDDKPIKKLDSVNDLPFSENDEAFLAKIGRAAPSKSRFHLLLAGNLLLICGILVWWWVHRRRATIT
jgi:hypothetical protein